MLTLALVLLTPLAQASSEVAAPRESISRPSSGECTVVGLRPAPAAPRPAREAEGPEALVSSPAVEARTTTRVLGGGPSFSAARTLDLRLGAVVRRPVAPPARLELRLYTPKGHLYQTLRATPSGPPARGANPKTPAAWTAAVPVAGSAIVNHSLYGRWRVEPHLDGDPRPCGPAERFWITP